MRTIIIAAISLAAIAGGPLYAQDRQVRYPVAHADLDLSDPRDAARLQSRVRRAVNASCGSLSGASLVKEEAIYDCRDKAYARARPAMATLIARARSGQDVRTAAK